MHISGILDDKLLLQNYIKNNTTFSYFKLRLLTFCSQNENSAAKKWSNSGSRSLTFSHSPFGTFPSCDRMKKTSEIIWEMKASMMLAACFIKWWLLFPAKTVIVDVSEEFLLFAALSSQTVFSLLPLSNTLDFGSLHVPFDFYDPCVTIKIKWGSLFNLINSCRNQQGSHCMVVTTAHKWKVLLSQPEGLAVWNSWHFCEHPEFLLWQFITSLLLKWMIDNSYLWNCEMH